MRGWRTNTNSRSGRNRSNRKLAVIAETAQVLTDIIDTRRSLRLELIIVFLILFEVLITDLSARHGPARLAVDAVLAAPDPNADVPPLPRSSRIWRVIFGMDQGDKDWWRHGIFYQIYPRSFQDTQRRRGRRSQRDHRAVALSEGARRRCGLAVADLSVADGRFRLRHLRLHRHRSAVRHAWRISTRWSRPRMTRGLKLILDLVPNHTSDQHPWFIESAQLAR